MKIKLLNKAYKQGIDSFYNTFFTDKEAGLRLFVDHLRYHRDFYTITATTSIDKDIMLQTKVSTIAAAVAEFDAYDSCCEVDEKSFHLNNFFEIIKQNVEEWLE